MASSAAARSDNRSEVGVLSSEKYSTVEVRAEKKGPGDQPKGDEQTPMPMRRVQRVGNGPRPS
jgi:hypothetical protein